MTITILCQGTSSHAIIKKSYQIVARYILGKVMKFVKIKVMNVETSRGHFVPLYLGLISHCHYSNRHILGVRFTFFVSILAEFTKFRDVLVILIF